MATASNVLPIGTLRVPPVRWSLDRSRTRAWTSDELRPSQTVLRQVSSDRPRRRTSSYLPHSLALLANYDQRHRTPKHEPGWTTLYLTSRFGTAQSTFNRREYRQPRPRCPIKPVGYPVVYRQPCSLRGSFRTEQLSQSVHRLVLQGRTAMCTDMQTTLYNSRPVPTTLDNAGQHRHGSINNGHKPS